MSSERFFEEADRIEYWKAIGRITRRGTLSDLAVSDLARIREALGTGDTERAMGYLDHVHRMSLWMNASWIEWAITWAAFVEERFSKEEATRINRLAYDAWRAGVSRYGDGTDEEHAALELATRLLTPFEGGLEELARYRQAEVAGVPPRVSELHAEPNRTHSEIIGAIEEGDPEKASAGVERYARQARARHDLLAKYTWAYPGVVTEQHGQRVTEEGIRRSLELCGWYDDLWDLVARLDPEALAAVMAEELRAHHSGPDRDGSVRIEEDADRFRLIFEPCGSGQAMRQDADRDSASGFGVLLEPSPSTWGRAGEVPSYCAHCAVGEIASIERMGYPAWVTEFDPDASHPCGWTVFKDPDAIPEEYFRRLGSVKDPSAFRRPSREAP